MSRTGHGITEIIKKELKNGEKTGGDLRVTILNKKNPKKTEVRNIQRAYKRALNKLLETEEIEVIGYKKTGKVRQAFDEQSILFQLSKIKSPEEINLLLRQLEGSDEKKS